MENPNLQRRSEERSSLTIKSPDEETNAKISRLTDSAYSTSCSNSQSRKSHSSQSKRCGSNSSGSSGYNGQITDSGSNNVLDQSHETNKGIKRKKLTDTKVDDTRSEVRLKESESNFTAPLEQPNNVVVSKDVLQKPIPFLTRHGSDGNLEYIDPKSVQYLGYLPKDIKKTNIVHLFHPEDLVYLKHIYECIVKDGSAPRSKTYRMLACNGYYVKLQTEWSSFISPTSRKLEFVIGKHHVIEGPSQPEILKSPDTGMAPVMDLIVANRTLALRESIIKLMSDVNSKPSVVVKLQLTEVPSLMERLIKQTFKMHDDVDLQESVYNDREDSVKSVDVPLHHEDHSDHTKSSITKPPLVDYNILNYNENLKRYFDSQQFNSHEDNKTIDDDENMTRDSNTCMSPNNQESGDPNINSCEVSSTELANVQNPELNPLPCQHELLTVAALNKHTAEMELELVRLKSDSARVSYESRQMKDDHLARCNAAFYPTSTAESTTSKSQKPRRRKNPSARPSSSLRPLLPTSDANSQDSKNHEEVHSLRTLDPVPEAELRYGTSNNRSSCNSVDMMDRESSNSSFYASFLSKSGSAKDTEDNEKLELTDGVKNQSPELKPLESRIEESRPHYEPLPAEYLGPKRCDPPWANQASDTTKLLYQYQITLESLEKVLAEDKYKLLKMEQTPTVVEQLELLQKELITEVDAMKLNLKDVSASSSSSEDADIDSTATKRRRQCEYSQLAMIYEEDAPLPPPLADPEPSTNAPSCSYTH